MFNTMICSGATDTEISSDTKPNKLGVASHALPRATACGSDVVT